MHFGTRPAASASRKMKPVVRVPIGDRCAAPAMQEQVFVMNMREPRALRLLGGTTRHRWRGTRRDRARRHYAWLLSDAFILGLDKTPVHPLRLAGSGLRPFRPRAERGLLYRVWAADSRPIVSSCWRSPRRKCVGTVCGVTAQNGAGEAIDSNCCSCRSARGGRGSQRRDRRIGAAQGSTMAGRKPIDGAHAGQPRHVGRDQREPSCQRFMSGTAARSRRLRRRPVVAHQLA